MHSLSELFNTLALTFFIPLIIFPLTYMTIVVGLYLIHLLISQILAKGLGHFNVC